MPLCLVLEDRAACPPSHPTMDPWTCSTPALCQPRLGVQVSSCLRSPPQGESLRPPCMPWQFGALPRFREVPGGFHFGRTGLVRALLPDSLLLSLSLTVPAQCRPRRTEQSVCLFTPHGITLTHNWRFFGKRALQRIFETIRRWLMWLKFQQFSTEY